MDPISSFMQRRQGVASTVQYNRDLNTSMRRSGRIGGVRNVGMDASGRRVAMPTSAQIGAGTAPRSFYQSMAPTREGRVRASMLDGTFGAKRAAFNAGNKASQMDEFGTIRPSAPAAPNPYKDGGQLPTGEGGATAPKAPAPPKPAAPAAPAPTAGARVMAGLGMPGASGGPRVPFAPKPAKPAGRIVDETGDVTERIRQSLLNKSQASRAVAAPAAAPADDLVQRASALAAASKGINEAQARNERTQAEINKIKPAAPAASAAATAPAPAPASTATPAQIKPAAAPKPSAVDPALVDKRGFDAPDASSPGNWQFKPLPDKEATGIRRTAGRGEDRFNPLVAIPALFDGPNTGAGSQLPGFMGSQPTYPNAAERLKGDSEAIKDASKKGFLRTKRIPGQGGEPPKVQVNAPVMRESGERVTMPKFYQSRAK